MNILVNLKSAVPSVIFCNICAALMSIILARSVSPSLLGTWFIFVLIFSSLETINKLQHDTTFVNFVGKRKVNFEDTLPSILVISLISTCTVLLLFLFFEKKMINFFFNENFIEGNFLINFLPLILPLNIIFFNYLNFVLIKNISFYYFVQNVFWCIAILSIITTVYFFEYNLIGALLSYFVIPQIFGIIICMFKIHKNTKFKFKLNLDNIKKILSYSFHIYLFGLLTIYILNSYRLFGSKILINAEFAYFSLALIISNFITQPIPSALSTIVLSKLSNTNSVNFNAGKTIQVFRISLYINLLVSLITLLFISDLVNFFYGNQYDVVFLIYIKVVFAITLLNTSNTLATYFITSGEIKTNIKINILVCIFITLLSLILIPYFKIEGLILTLVLSSIFLFFLRIIFFSKKNKFGFKDYLITKKDIDDIFQIVKRKL